MLPKDIDNILPVKPIPLTKQEQEWAHEVAKNYLSHFEFDNPIPSFSVSLRTVC